MSVLATVRKPIVVLDVSRSMILPLSNDGGPSRLAFATGFARRIISEDDSLVVFDLDVKVTRLRNVGLGGTESRIGSALVFASNEEQFENQDSILLLTDGHETATHYDLRARQMVDRHDIPPVYAVGIGIDADVKLLKYLADKTHGNFMHLRTA